MLVDGAQSAGAIPVDATAVDYYTVSGQKWLCGPDATGGARTSRDPEALHVALPSYFSQDGYEPSGDVHAASRGGALRQRLDPGRRRSPGSTQRSRRVPTGRFEHAAEISARCRRCSRERFEVVTAPGQATSSPSAPTGDPAELVAALYEQGVIVRDMPGRPGCASPAAGGRATTT